jgi:DNA (cytosine-5)-methyltransferase 1
MARDYKDAKDLVTESSVYPINTMTLGGRPDPVNDRRMTMKVGDDGDPQFTISATQPHAVAIVEPATFVKVIRAGARDAEGNLPPEVWREVETNPTISAWDQSDKRTVVAIVESENELPALLTMREGVTGQGGRGPLIKYDQSLTLATGNGQVLFNQEETKLAVRRLTPLECERLQGFPDGWTEGQADSHRYKQMGNAVAVPVVEWVIQGIIKAEQE